MPDRGPFRDLELLPMHHRRWRRRARLQVTGALAMLCGGAMAIPYTSALSWCVVIAALSWLTHLLARTRHRHEVALRLAFRSRLDVTRTVSEVEQLVTAADSDSPLRARLLATLAELELTLGDAPRGDRLFESLRARGWSARVLAAASPAGIARSLEPVAVLATLEALRDDPAEVAVTVEEIERRGGAAVAVLPRAVLCFRGGRPAEAARLLAGRGHESATLVSPEIAAALTLLDSFAHASAGEHPYRARSSSPASVRWLTARWPALAAFASVG